MSRWIGLWILVTLFPNARAFTSEPAVKQGPANVINSALSSSDTNCLNDLSCFPASRIDGPAIQVADGWPPPWECGIYDICHSTAAPESTPASLQPAANGPAIQVADGWPPPWECGIYDICHSAVA